jgi:hypothetical protein
MTDLDAANSYKDCEFDSLFEDGKEILEDELISPIFFNFEYNNSCLPTFTRKGRVKKSSITVNDFNISNRLEPIYLENHRNRTWRHPW